METNIKQSETSYEADRVPATNEKKPGTIVETSRLHESTISPTSGMDGLEYVHKYNITRDA